MWSLASKSVRGAIHERKSIVNQDYVSSYVGKDGWPIIMSLSDGHGGSKYFRSDVGSKQAVDSAIHTLRVFYDETKGLENPKMVKILAENILGERLVGDWLDHIMDYHDKNNFKIWELCRLAYEENQEASNAVEANYKIAYGATSVSVMITPHWILYAILGDGDILCVTSKKSVYQPIKGNKNEDTTQTSSLVNSDAAKRYKFGLQSVDNFPSLILMSTDGYENSYPDNRDYLNIGPEYYNMISSLGKEWKSKLDLEKILTYVTTQGSGDDVTLGILYKEGE